MAKKGVKIYNVMFPIWFLLVFPITWLFVLPANFIIDSAVLLITLKTLSIEGMWTHYKKAILPIWLIGFLSDFAGAAFLFLSQIMPGEWLYENITKPVAMNPFSSAFGFFYTAIGVAITGVLIYFLNKKISMKRLAIPDEAKKRICLCLAIFTAAYAFFIPSSWFYF